MTHWFQDLSISLQNWWESCRIVWSENCLVHLIFLYALSYSRHCSDVWFVHIHHIPSFTTCSLMTNYLLVNSCFSLQSLFCVCSLVRGLQKLSVMMKILSGFEPQQELGGATKISSEIRDVPKFNKCETCVFMSLDSFPNCEAMYTRQCSVHQAATLYTVWSFTAGHKSLTNRWQGLKHIYLQCFCACLGVNQCINAAKPMTFTRLALCLDR